MLGSLSYSSGTLLKEEFYIISASKGEGKVLNGTISFIANKEVDLKIILGGIEVVKTMNFTANLQLLIFKEDVLTTKTLLFEFRAPLMAW
jgi:hypothetical protein